MTLSTTVSSTTATGNGVTTVWPWTGFRIDSADDLRVVLKTIATGAETLIDPALYSATGFGLDAGGSVTYPLSGSPIASTHQIIISRVITPVQLLDIQNQGGFYPETAEAQLDRMTMMIQQLRDQLAVIAGGSYLAGGSFLPIAGGTLTGDTTLSSADLILTRPAGNARSIIGKTGTSQRWRMELGSSDAESGANAGSHLQLKRYDDSGALLGTPLKVFRDSGTVLHGGKTVLNDDFDFNLDIVSSKPRVTFAPNDYIEYDRTNNEHEFYIGGAFQFSVSNGFTWNAGSAFYGNDANFSLAFSGSDPRLTMDSNDYIELFRSSSRWRFVVGGAVQMYIDANSITSQIKHIFTPSASEAGLNITVAAAPSSPTSGDIWLTTVGAYTRFASQNNLIETAQFMTLTSNYTLTSTTTAQKAFNVPANGAFNAKAGETYLFEGFINLDTMSASSGSFGFALAGTATTSRVVYDTLGNKATLATAAAPQATVNSGTTLPVANTAVVTATTATVGWMKIKGIARVTGAGTLIPQVSLGVANAARVLADSWFIFKQLGTDSVTTQGDIS